MALIGRKYAEEKGLNKEKNKEERQDNKQKESLSDLSNDGAIPSPA